MNSSLRIVFAGTAPFAVPALEALHDAHTILAVYTQPDRKAGRGRKLRASPVKESAERLGLPVAQPESLNNDAGLQPLLALGADVIVVAAYGLLIPPPVLEQPALGCINIHASLLPGWRGAAPIQRAILAGDSEAGVTIMQMDAGLDTGDMLLKRSTPIEARDTAGSLHDRLATLGRDAIVEALQLAAAGALQPIPQNESEASYAHKLHKAEADLDWACSATGLARRIQAFNPWPVAQTRYRGETLRIWQASVVAGSTDAIPGTVLDTANPGINVATGKGILSVETLQRPGGKPVSAIDFLNSNSLTGTRFPC